MNRSGAFFSAGDVLAVLAVDRDPAAERDVADDLVAGNRAAALGQPHHDVVDALDVDPVVRMRPGCGAGARPRRAGRLGAVASAASSTASPALSRCMQLVGDRLRRDLALAEARCRSRRPCGSPSRGSRRRAAASRRSSASAGRAFAAPPASFSRPRRSASSRRSRLRKARILLRARLVRTRLSQSREGPRSCFAVRISTMSPTSAGSAAGRSCR